MALINEYRKIVVKDVFGALMKSGHSIWSISCAWHADIINMSDDIYDSDLQRVPKENGLTMRDAVEGFVLSGRRIVAIDLE